MCDAMCNCNSSTPEPAPSQCHNGGKCQMHEQCGGLENGYCHRGTCFCFLTPPAPTSMPPAPAQCQVCAQCKSAEHCGGMENGWCDPRLLCNTTW